MPSKLLATILMAVTASLAAAGEAPDREVKSFQLAQAECGASRPVRQIAPDLIAPPQIGGGELRRTDPRAPLSDIGPAAPAAPATANATADAKEGRNMIFGPVATAAGRLEAEGMVIAIAGIEIVEPEHTCHGSKGDWPCGMAARTAFRSFLRGRALDCDIPEGELPARLSVACRLGSQDLGAWLVANGWAKVSSTGPYAEQQNEALAERRGIFGPGPERLPGTGLPDEPVAEGQPLPPVPALDGAAEATAEPESGTPVSRPAAIEPFLREPKGLY
ncbi:thermonuclease family protein [Aquibium pacificus]|uniref:thermonuclease family protein n=1 Tax=Aquibium pacificus TaxID=3153579 RepID=UPI00349F4C0B